MTAKRFTVKQRQGATIYSIEDYYGELPLNEGIYYKSNADKLCKWLNTQNETIERLKQNIDELMQIDIEEDLLKENKQLKQSNERLLKMLDNVANYMQKQNKYMPIDDFAEWWNGIATKGLDDGDVE